MVFIYIFIKFEVDDQIDQRYLVYDLVSSVIYNNACWYVDYFLHSIKFLYKNICCSCRKQQQFCNVLLSNDFSSSKFLFHSEIQWMVHIFAAIVNQTNKTLNHYMVNYVLISLYKRITDNTTDTRRLCSINIEISFWCSFNAFNSLRQEN